MREVMKRLLFIPITIGIVLALILMERMAFYTDIFVQYYVAAESAAESAAEICPKTGKPIAIRVPEAPTDGEKLLDLNRATQGELDALPGIGKVRAADIIKQREKMGGFCSTADIMCTKGVGKSTYEKINDMVTVSARD